MPDYAVGESNNGGKMVADMGKLLKSPSFWLKVIELLLTFLMIALMHNGGYYTGIPPANMSKAFVAFGTPYCFLIINAIMLIAFIMDEGFSKRIVMLICFLAGVLYITAGALLIEFWDRTSLKLTNDLTLGSGILGVIIGVIYLVDTGFTFKFD